jgi:UDP-2-acetamido-3-amino-2,3-dideoxy-glucuronate N-acetyltransferase
MQPEEGGPVGNSSIIHQPSLVWDTAYIGERTIVWYFAQVGDGVVIGDDCVIGSSCYIGFKSRLGNRVHVNHGSFLPNRSSIGHDVFIGPNVTFCDDKYPKSGNTHYKAEPPVVENEVSVGAGAIILPGVTLGKGCMIGAGAVVTGDVPPGAIVTGIPARAL